MSSYRRRLLLANQGEENLYLYGNSVQAGTPTPEAPIDIMSVDNPTIKITGNNLFNNDFSLIKKVNFLNTANTERNHYGYEIVLPVGTYTIKAYQKPNFEAPVYIYGALVDANYIAKQTVNTVINLEFRTVTFTVEKGDKLLIFDGYDANSSNQAHAESFFSMVDVMLNEGTEALPYEPYEEELITIDETTPFGKNLIPYPPCSVDSIAVDNKNGTYGVNGTLKAGVYYGVNIIKTNLGDYLEHGKYYTMSLEGLNIPDGFNSIGLYIKCLNKETSANAWPHQCLLTSNGFMKSTFYVDKDKYDYLELFIQINPIAADLTVSDMLVIPMLNEGKEVLPFEPYIPPITSMRGIGDYKDRIYTKDGKVWFEQLINYVKLTRFAGAISGSATINSFSGAIAPKVVNDDYPYVTASEQISNIGIYKVTYSKTGKLHWYIARDAAYLIPPDAETWTNGTDAYEYFMSVTGNVPMEYQYVLATPITTEITGYLAEKILAIDKTKNITITSENGVSGSVEVID